MKKLFISVLLSVGIIATASAQKKLVGDMNGDEKLTVLDVAELVNVILGKQPQTYFYSVEDFIRENSLTGKYRINGKENNYINGEYDPYNGHEYVDLGLPSGLKWATMNIGATEVAGTKKNSHTGKLDCYGEYYAWGEISPKDNYTWTTYSLCDGTDETMNKYCTDSDYGTIDGKTTIELSPICDDVASANWGGDWRMPTKKEMDELCDKCYWEWTNSYNNSGVTGFIIYKAKMENDKGIKRYDGEKSNTSASYDLSDYHIFFPAVGMRNEDIFDGTDYCGFYWSSSLCLDEQSAAYLLSIFQDDIDVEGWYRNCGLPIRAVCP